MGYKKELQVKIFSEYENSFNYNGIFGFANFS